MDLESAQASSGNHNLVALYELNKHYDTMINDVDIRAENLIELINKSRFEMQQQINEEREVAAERIRSSAALRAKDNADTNTDTDPEKEAAAIARESLYLSDDERVLATPLLGHLFTRNNYANFVKIRNLDSIMSSIRKESLDATTKSTSTFIRLAPLSDQGRATLRHKIIPLRRERIVSVRFTADRSLCLDLFDESGTLLKSIEPFTNLSGFPHSHGYANRIVVSFSAKGKRGGFTTLDDNPTSLYVFDDELNVLKRLEKYPSCIDSLFIDAKRIVVGHTYRQNACSVFDLELNERCNFGQHKDPEAAFFMLPVEREWRSQPYGIHRRTPNQKSVIFGVTDEPNSRRSVGDRDGIGCVFFHNEREMAAMSVKSGEWVARKTWNECEDVPTFMLDEQRNVLQVHRLSKRVRIYTHDFGYSIENSYGHDWHDVCVTCDNQLVFINEANNELLFI